MIKSRRVLCLVDIVKSLTTGLRHCFKKVTTDTTPTHLWKDDIVLMVNQNKCVGCGSCERMCPCSAIRISDQCKITWTKSRCSNCRLCQNICGCKAITFITIQAKSVTETRDAS